jgi:hypothetical protein
MPLSFLETHSYRNDNDWLRTRRWEMHRTTRRKAAGLGFAFIMALAVYPSGVASAGTCPVPLPQGGDPVSLDPANFADRIDNTFLPFLPGSVWTYRETDSEGARMKVRVSVTDRTRQILGIDATVVHDKVTERGELVENTFDWYAQDECGNVWYMGENTKEYENGVVVSTEGSWEAGVDGAQPGIVMPGNPQVGQAYRQEFYAGQAEDSAEIASLDEQAQVPFGHFRPVIMTRDTTPLHPRILEYKFYAEGVGVVLAVGISGGADREELLRFSSGSS